MSLLKSLAELFKSPKPKTATVLGISVELQFDDNTVRHVEFEGDVSSHFIYSRVHYDITHGGRQLENMLKKWKTQGWMQFGDEYKNFSDLVGIEITCHKSRVVTLSHS